MLLLSCALAATAPARAASVLEPFIDLAAPDRPQGSAGIDWVADDFRVRSHLTVRRDGDRTRIAPHLLSTFAIAPKVSVETRLDLADWNSQSPRLDSTVEVKFRVRSELPVIDAFEGQIGRAPDGSLRSSLRLALAEEVLSGGIARSPVTFRANVLFEESDAQGAAATTSRGLQATLTGFGRTAAENRVAISYRADSGRVADQASAISFGRAWPINPSTRIMLNCELVRAELAPNHNISLSWHGEF